MCVCVGGYCTLGQQMHTLKKCLYMVLYTFTQGRGNCSKLNYKYPSKIGKNQSKAYQINAMKSKNAKASMSTLLGDTHYIVLEAKPMRQPRKPHWMMDSFTHSSVCARVSVHVLCMRAHIHIGANSWRQVFSATFYLPPQVTKPKLVQLSWPGPVKKPKGCPSLPPTLGRQDTPGFLMWMLGIKLTSSSLHGKRHQLPSPKPQLCLFLEAGWVILAKVMLRILYYGLLSCLSKIYSSTLKITSMSSD